MLYFDHNSTTPVDSRVADVLDQATRNFFGNASSIHMAGQKARQLLEGARRSIARNLGAHESEMIFTSGGTESNNLAIQGSVQPGMHVITIAIEHPAVLEPLRRLEQQGAEVSYLPVTSAGVLQLDALSESLRPNTALVSIMAANNETGVIQPLSEIAALLRAHNPQILFHTDAVQAVGKMPVDLPKLGVDMCSISSHKLYAPKGFGALYVRKGVKLKSMQLGGRHERGFRAGTENVTGAMALDCALSLFTADERTHVRALRDAFEQRLKLEVPHAIINAAAAPRLSNTSNVLFPDISGEALVIALDMCGMCVSTGSACSSGSVEPSHVLLEMGLTPKQARSCIRFSFGRQNTIADIHSLVAAVAQSVTKLRLKTRENQLV